MELCNLTNRVVQISPQRAQEHNVMTLLNAHNVDTIRPQPPVPKFQPTF
jgi:hypothetical protein